MPEPTRKRPRRARPLIALLVLALSACGGAVDRQERAELLSVDSSSSLAAAGAATAQRLPEVRATTAAATTPSGESASAPWQLTLQPADAQVLPGEAASFQVRAEGSSGAFDYQWLRDGEPIDGATGSQYCFVTTLDDGGATFSVRVRPRGADRGQERESAAASIVWRHTAS